MIPTKDIFIKLKKKISDEKKILRELDSFYSELKRVGDTSEKNMINSQIKSLSDSFKKTSKEIREILEGLSLVKSLHGPKRIRLPKLVDLQKEKRVYAPERVEKTKKQEIKESKKIISSLEKRTLRRLRKNLDSLRNLDWS